MAALVALLGAHGVRCVADVRRHPGSRRHPHFAAVPLAATLAGHGIAYERLPALGGRRAPTPGSPNGGWRDDRFRGYADHMASAEFACGLERFEALAGAAPTAALCAEALWWRCHRRLLADALVVRGWAVAHIAADGAGTAHVRTEFAVVGADMALTYPPAQMSLGGD